MPGSTQNSNGHTTSCQALPCGCFSAEWHERNKAICEGAAAFRELKTALREAIEPLCLPVLNVLARILKWAEHQTLFRKR